jgi:hypothetical protein
MTVRLLASRRIKEEVAWQYLEIFRMMVILYA